MQERNMTEGNTSVGRCCDYGHGIVFVGAAPGLGAEAEHRQGALYEWHVCMNKRQSARSVPWLHLALVLKQNTSRVPMDTAKLANRMAGDDSMNAFTPGLPMIVAPMTVVRVSWAKRRPATRKGYRGEDNIWCVIITSGASL